MSSTDLHSALLEHLKLIATGTDFANTIDLLPADQRQALFHFFCALACKTEAEYQSIAVDSDQNMSDDFKERVTLVARAFCIGHDWVTNNWAIWVK